MTASPSDPVPLEALGLTKTYARGRGRPAETALQDFDLRLGPGEVLVLAGANGAGKSTALKIMAGLELPDQGRVRVLGQSPRALEARRRCAWLPDATELFPFLDWRETLSYFARIGEGAGAELRERVDRLGETWGLTHYGRKRVRGFSLGMRRRLAIASVLVGAPRVLLLDEPVSGLDPEGQVLFTRELRRVKDGGACVVLSSHHLARLGDFADHLVILRGGRRVLSGRLDEVAAGLRSRDLTVTGLDEAGLALLGERVRELGGEMEAPRLPLVELEALVLGDDPAPPGSTTVEGEGR